MTTRNFITIIFLLAYITPFLFIANNNPSLTFYDLAEWTTLLPGERSSFPPLTIAFALRLNILLLVLYLASVYHPTLLLHKVVLYGAIVSLVIAQLPPLEILQTLQDTNYQQQLLFAIVSTAILLLKIQLPRLFNDYEKFVCLFIAFLGTTALLFAWQHTSKSFSDYKLVAQPAIALGLFFLTYSLCFVYGIKQKRDAMASRLILQKSET